MTPRTNVAEQVEILQAVLCMRLPEGWHIVDWILDTGAALEIVVRLPDGEEVTVSDPHFPKDRLADRQHNLRRGVRALVLERLHPLP